MAIKEGFRFQVINERFDGAFLRKFRVKRKEGMSWRNLAHWIKDQTGLQVSHETLRSWARELGIPEPTAPKSKAN